MAKSKEQPSKAVFDKAKEAVVIHTHRIGDLLGDGLIAVNGNELNEFFWRAARGGVVTGQPARSAYKKITGIELP